MIPNLLAIVPEEVSKFFKVQKMEKLKSICLQYAAVTQWLITSSIDIPKGETQSEAAGEAKKSKLVKRRASSLKLKLATEDKSVIEPIL